MFNTKHRVAKLGTLLAVASLGLAGLTGVAPASAADVTTTFKIHLDKTLPDSTGVNAWIWGVDAGSSDAASTPDFTNEDGYGSYAQFDVTQPSAPTALGFKIRGDESWDHVITGSDQSLPVTGDVNEIWCYFDTGLCSTDAPTNTPLTVRVHVNKALADIASWNVYYFNNDHVGTADADTAQFTHSDDLGSFSEFKLYQDVSHVYPPTNQTVGSDFGKPFGLIVRVDEGWTKKASGNDDIIPTWNNGVAEVWCETVDVAHLGCSATPPAPVTHLTVHINEPLDATHNYVIWDNHETNNTDVLFAPTFTSEDRYGAIAKWSFQDESVKQVRFYITDGRSFDSTKISGARDFTIPVTTYNGEVWCDLVADTCATSSPDETFNFTVHVNKAVADVTDWNVWDWGVGAGSVYHSAPTPEENIHTFVADGDNNSVATWSVTTDSFPGVDSYGFLVRKGLSWDGGAQKLTIGDQHAKINAANIEVWCDATALVIPETGDAQAGSGLSCSQTPATSITVHYNRPLRALLAGNWELAAFGTGVSGDTDVQFTGEDLFGATAVIHYNPSITDVSNISFVVRKHQPFVAATDSTVQKNLDTWSCIDPMEDCTGGYFRQTTGDRVVPAGASEVWALAGSSAISATEFTVPSNKVVLKVKQFARGAVRVWATAGAGTTPTAIVIDAKSAGKKTVQCTIARRVTGTTLKSYCNIWGLKKGAKYTFVAHAVAYGIGTSLQSARTKAIVLR